MKGSRSIRYAVAALLLIAVAQPSREWAWASDTGYALHEKGRVRASLPPDGGLGATALLRWPGPEGDLFLGRGGFLLGFTNASGEPSSHGPFEAVELERRELFDGCDNGKRYPHPLRDDDGDGLIDEDPLDGADNDGDGSIDEDFAAIGDEMRVTVAVDGETGLVRRQRSYTWNAGHVRDFIGFTTSIIYPEEETGFLGDFEALLYIDFDIGRENDPARGSNDHFFVIEKEWDGGTLRMPAARDGDRFAALLLLDTLGPNGEEIGAEALLLRAVESPAGLLGGGPLERGGDETPVSNQPPVRILGGADPDAETDERAATSADPASIEGDGAMACRFEPIPELWPGDELTVHWAIVFGKSERTLTRNALRALETYEGVPDGEGALHRWIVPARRAGRIELEAQPAYVWAHGCRQPAAAITLPAQLEEEEIEWLRGSGAAPVRYQQVGSKVLVTVDGEVDEATIFIEGQMTDGTIFTAALRGDMLLGGDDDEEPEDTLPDESIQLYPNPFLTNLNIGLRVFDSALTEESTGSSSVRIYDVRGRLVRTILEQGPIHPGEYQYSWDGHDEYGKEAAPGVYYVKLQIGDRSVTKRVILIR